MNPNSDSPYRGAQKMLESSNRTTKFQKFCSGMMFPCVFAFGLTVGIQVYHQYMPAEEITKETVVHHMIQEVPKEVQVIKEVEKVVIKEVPPPDVCNDSFEIVPEQNKALKFTCPHPKQKMAVGIADGYIMGVYQIHCGCAR